VASNHKQSQAERPQERKQAMEKQESRRRFPAFPQPRRLRTITSHGIRIPRARSARKSSSASPYSRSHLWNLAKAGKIERVGRGLYRAKEAPISTNGTLLEVAKRVPPGVLCLSSALRLHELTIETRSKSGLPSSEEPGPQNWTILLFASPTSPKPPSSSGSKPIRWKGERCASILRHPTFYVPS
jgi:hypothetical protein